MYVLTVTYPALHVAVETIMIVHLVHFPMAIYSENV